jgi:hypothetical protein
MVAAVRGAPSIADRLIEAIASRLAEDPRIPPEGRAAFRETAQAVMQQQLSALFGGETVRFYVPKRGS